MLNKPSKVLNIKKYSGEFSMIADFEESKGCGDVKFAPIDNQDIRDDNSVNGLELSLFVRFFSFFLFFWVDVGMFFDRLPSPGHDVPQY